MIIFIRSTLNMDHLAGIIRGVLNIAPSNITRHQVEQKRYGVSKGGYYWLFEMSGIELSLLQNVGDNQLAGCEQWDEYPYYIHVDFQIESDQETQSVMVKYLCSYLSQSGIQAEMHTG